MHITHTDVLMPIMSAFTPHQTRHVSHLAAAFVESHPSTSRFKYTLICVADRVKACQVSAQP